VVAAVVRMVMTVVDLAVVAAVDVVVAEVVVVDDEDVAVMATRHNGCP